MLGHQRPGTGASWRGRVGWRQAEQRKAAREQSGGGAGRVGRGRPDLQAVGSGLDP